MKHIFEGVIGQSIWAVEQEFCLLMCDLIKTYPLDKHFFLYFEFLMQVQIFVELLKYELHISVSDSTNFEIERRENGKYLG